MPLQPSRTVAELRELQRLTGDEAGAQRVCWTPAWLQAREWLQSKLAELPGVEHEIDEAGNQWGTLGGRSPGALLIGGHLDSVPNGGWLDGCLNVVAGLEVLRRLATEGTPELTVRLVSWADEEGARFGRSLFGSSAASGTMDPEALRTLKDRDGIALPEALAACGVELGRAGESRRQLRNAAAYLELHIEQGPVLERLDLPLGVVLGTFGVERHLVRFLGQSAHAGSTPMDARRDAFAAAARLALEVREIAKREGGVGTVGRVVTRPGIVTAIPGECEITLDQRDLDAGALARMHERAVEAGRRLAEEEGVRVEWERLWRIQPLHFDPELIEICAAAITEIVGHVHPLPSGPLHDAAEMVRAGVPTAMIFVQSLNGLSHTKEEDTRPEHLELAVEALDRSTTATLEWAARRSR
ncbi:MAG: Zn-dependent hydrolase [Candidatus Nephthysia bennettiae]|uniref:Zn-dependent hydrolase n=1 Tax=Candidatus Nephthysia bennettiae TaxID=3127016 RepID=A0A934N9A0_9BACT|nr:Zn-dependent hydrolase [Candidatus Dormibacteraeota bacterium]MBJ7615020.1 Zn-dependent hydrolase [Candidatus Dormibacteraeota bacterium]PZR95784.1 MAG: Zn-dependent hydrolase [Candidatus Dormibacteraeota bacterium]